MEPSRIRPRIVAVGDTAILVEFGEAIDEAVNGLVLQLDRRLADDVDVVESIPTYRSLLVRYDPTSTTYDALAHRLRAMAGDEGIGPRDGQLWSVPVVYGGTYGIDLDITAERHGISPSELVRRHVAPTYRVYMTGFLPGFAYLGGLDPSIATPRRTSPRLRTPAGTISIGGVQALVATLEAPSGWHLLGRTPFRNFVRGRNPAVMIQPGDRVRFRPILAEDFAELDAKAADGEVVADRVSDPDPATP